MQLLQKRKRRRKMSEPKNPHTGSDFEEFMGALDEAGPTTTAALMEPIPNAFNISDVQIAKLSLAEGEILTMRIFSDSVNELDLAMLKRQLTSVFPHNRILLFSMAKGDRMEIEVVAPEAPAVSPCTEPENYCNSCACGKKERIEAERKKE
jgi:hypothetical protein